MRLFSVTVTVLSLFLASCNAQESDTLKTSDSKATTETIDLFNNMNSLLAKGIMFGHQDDLAYGISWKYPNGESDVKRVCADFPAVYGWDLGGIETNSTVNLDSVPFDVIRKLATEAYAKGSINSFSWHLANPLTGKNAWDVTTPNVVKSIIPGGAKHELYKEWLNRVADFTTSIKTTDGRAVPIIFRPFHEFNGGWFWWGQKYCTTSDYKTLWQFTVTYLRDTKQVHNILYAFSSTEDFTSEETFFERYPGNEYIDIIGFDFYHFNGVTGQDFVGKVRPKLLLLSEIAKKHKKIAALTETGYEQIPDQKWWTNVLWETIRETNISYVLLWRNAWNRPNHFYAPYPGHSSEANFYEFYKLKETLFQSEVKR